MSYIVQKSLPKASDVLEAIPLEASCAQQVQDDQEEIKKILRGESNKKIVIIGPCSAWPESAVLDYVKQIKPIAKKIESKIKIVIRSYIQKPRTTIGWLGPLNQPDPQGEIDIEKGIYYCRKMMVDIVKEGLAIADEALFTHNDSYFIDLIAWLAIGARSSEDQEHRIFASMISQPIGMKNPTFGDIDIGINSVIAAQYPHTFAFHRNQIETQGNPYAHLILRGGKDKTNYDGDSLKYAATKMIEKSVKNPSIIVDASHDNAIDSETGKKEPLLQPKTVLSVLQSMKRDPFVAEHVKGFMIESFIKEGKQDINNKDLVYGQSITDPCLGIAESIELLEQMFDEL